MEQVDFTYVDHDGCTIYRKCFEKYVQARFVLKKTVFEWSKIVTEVEQVFDLLVVEGNKNGFNVNSILQAPDLSGLTCFSIASGCSEKICNYIIERGGEVNSITTYMDVANFKYPDLAIPMMTENINPYVIDGSGRSPIDNFPSSFESEEAKR